MKPQAIGIPTLLPGFDTLTLCSAATGDRGIRYAPRNVGIKGFMTVGLIGGLMTTSLIRIGQRGVHDEQEAIMGQVEGIQAAMQRNPEIPVSRIRPDRVSRRTMEMKAIAVPPQRGPLDHIRDMTDQEFHSMILGIQGATIINTFAWGLFLLTH